MRTEDPPNSAVAFFVTGGTLAADAPSYVERQADRDLYDALSHGEFCYVLDSRQMGKSSLMTRTARRLLDDGGAVVILDLTAIGQNVSAEQWYDGLRDLLGQQLGLEDELDDFWVDQMHLGPLQRWVKALREVVLARRPGPIVLSLEEIDVVLGLPFSTDEFFAGIRQCYNERTQDPEFQRLTFCLIGVASPTDLIRDTRLTPFNIGRRIELTDFSLEEALPLAAGLVEDGDFTSRFARDTEDTENTEETARIWLQRILYWTGGHPYLTQRLCRAIVEQGSTSPNSAPFFSVSSVSLAKRLVKPSPPQTVDAMCEALFLTRAAREADDNLAFVRNRLLNSEADLAALLDHYARVRAGKRLLDDEGNPLTAVLRLSGVTRSVGGALQVRNRIYERVFDRDWVRTSMPDAELRRQRAAYRRGLMRATALSAIVVAIVGGLAVTAVGQANRADRERRVSEESRRTLRRNLYATQVRVAQQDWEVGNVARARALLTAQIPKSGEEDLRGFEWRYLWARCRDQSLHTLRVGADALEALAISPDGQTLASSGSDIKAIRLWDMRTRRGVAVLRGHRTFVVNACFSLDGKTLATSSLDGEVRLWDVPSRRALADLPGHTAAVHSVAFSPDSRILASASFDQTVRLWDRAARRCVAVLKGHRNAVGGVAFSPDGRFLASGSRDATVKLWAMATRQVVATLRGSLTTLSSVAYSPNGKILAAADLNGRIECWDLATRRSVATFRGHTSEVVCVAFSPDGRTLASGSHDHTIRLWDLASRQEIIALKGHANGVSEVAYFPDGTLASASHDGTVKLWNPRANLEPATLLKGGSAIASLAFAPDGGQLATGQQDGTIRLWDAATGRTSVGFKAHTGHVKSVAFSPDGRYLASNGEDRTVKLWDLRSRKVVATLSEAAAPGWTTGVAFSSDGRLLAYQSGDTRVTLWDVNSRHSVASTAGHTDKVFAIAFSPRGNLLATGSADRSIKLWDPRLRRELKTLKGHDTHIHYLAFSADGTRVAGGGDGPTVRLWDVATGAKIADLQAVGVAKAVALSPDGKTLATGGSLVAPLLNVTTGQEVAVLKGHEGPIHALAFSPDGNTLATGSFDGTVRLWRAPLLAGLQIPVFVTSPNEPASQKMTKFTGTETSHPTLIGLYSSPP